MGSGLSNLGYNYNKRTHGSDYADIFTSRAAKFKRCCDKSLSHKELKTKFDQAAKMRKSEKSPLISNRQN